VPIPEELVNYFQSFISDVDSRFRGTLFRYGGPPEGAFWVANNGFKVEETDTKKMCCTISPMLYVGLMQPCKPTLMAIDGEIYDQSRVIPYTHDRDPVSRDPVYPMEFECSFYYAPEFGYQTKFVDVRYLSWARVVRGVDLYITEYKRAKVLPVFLHGRPYARFGFTMLPSYLLIKQLAIVAVAAWDDKMKYALAYSWDKYWEPLGKLAAPPNYAWCLGFYESSEFKRYYDEYKLKKTLADNLIPQDRWGELMDPLRAEVNRIYGLVGVELVWTGSTASAPPPSAAASDKAYELYSRFPDLLPSPEAAERAIKWWHSSYDDLVRYLELLRRESYEPTTNADLDPEAVREDYP
jgi:hypothetical protein